MTATTDLRLPDGLSAGDIYHRIAATLGDAAPPPDSEVVSELAALLDVLPEFAELPDADRRDAVGVLAAVTLDPSVDSAIEGLFARATTIKAGAADWTRADKSRPDGLRIAHALRAVAFTLESVWIVPREPR